MKSKILLAIVSSVYAFESCGDHEISLNAVRSNDNIKFTIIGEAKQQLNNPIFDIKASAVGIPVTEDYIEVCQIPGVQCPIQKGTVFEFDVEHTLPEQLPKSVSLDVVAKTFEKDTKEEVFCSKGSVDALNGFESAHKNGLVFATRFGFSESEVSFLFDKWFSHFQHDLPLPIDDLKRRLKNFRDNLLKIVFHNAGGHTYSMAMNQFGHMDAEEFKSTMLGYKKPLQSFESTLKSNIHKYNGEDLPDSVDWTQKGAVTPVKNQGACGSCWSFSTTGSIEGAYFLKYGKLISFSEEQLVTCDHTDMGCNGGLMDYAFQWIERHGGLCTEEEVPYTSGGGSMPSCKRCNIVPNSAPKSYNDVAHDEKSLMSAVKQQPVSIAIEADQGAFQFYSGGVLTGRCGTALDHGVLLVGYGTEDGVDYWKVKNSWGASWGDHGYIKFQRGKAQAGGECGILNSASYPVY